MLPDWDHLVAVEDHRFTGFYQVCCGRRWSKLARHCGRCGTLTSSATVEAQPPLECLPDPNPSSRRHAPGLGLSLVPKPSPSEEELDVGDIVDQVREGGRSWHV